MWWLGAAGTYVVLCSGRMVGRALRYRLLRHEHPEMFDPEWVMENLRLAMDDYA